MAHALNKFFVINYIDAITLVSRCPSILVEVCLLCFSPHSFEELAAF